MTIEHELARIADALEKLGTGNAEPTTPKKTRRSPAKAAKDTGQTAQESALPDESAESTATEVSAEDLNAELVTIARDLGTQGVSSVMALLKEFGVNKITELAADQRAPMLQKARGLTDG